MTAIKKAAPLLALLVVALSPAHAQVFTNATKLLGRPLCKPGTPSDGTAIVWNATASCWDVQATPTGGATGPAGPTGPTGATGATGATGPAGPAGPSGNTSMPSATFATPPTPGTANVYWFTDAASNGVCVGGGTGKTACRWNGTGWDVVGGGSGGASPAGSTGAVQTNGGSGALGDSGCTASSGTITCTGFASSGPFSITGAEQAASGVTAPASGSDTLVFDSTTHHVTRLDHAGTAHTLPETAGTDYAPATNGTSGQILTSNGSGGFGTAVTIGTSANNLVKLDGSAKLPAVDGSQLTNLPAAGGGVPYTGATQTVDLNSQNLRDTGNIETPDPLLVRWYTALAANSAKWVAIGDSVTQGYHALPSTGAGSVNGYVNLISNAVYSKYQSATPGVYFVSSTSLGLGAMSLTGTWTAVSGWGVSTNSGTPYSAGSSATASLSSIYAASFDIYYLTNTDTASGFTVTIDGGAPATVGNTTSGSLTWAKANVSAGSLGTHSFTITAPSSGNAYIYTVVPVTLTTGLQTLQMGNSGTTASNWCSNAAQNIGWLVQANPDLISIELGTNDYTGAPSTWQTNLTSCVSWIKSNTGAAVILIDPHEKSGCNSSSCGSSTLTAFQAATRAVAVTYGCAYINIADRWGSYANANALGLMYDTLHPSTTGHADQAAYLQRRMFPSAFPAPTGPVFKDAASQHYIGSGSASAAFGAGAGSSPSWNATFTGSDSAGIIKIQTLSGTASGALVKVTFSRTYAGTGVVCVIGPAGSIPTTPVYALNETGDFYLWATGAVGVGNWAWTYICQQPQ